MLLKGESMLTFRVERETQAGSQQYITRNCRIAHRGSEGDSSLWRTGFTQGFQTLGSKVAIVQQARSNLLDQLGVDAALEIDGGPPIHDPLIIEHSTRNMAGFTFTGDPKRDAEKLKPGRSLESIRVITGGSSRIIKAGFTPREEAHLPIGRTVDGKGVRIRFQDMRRPPDTNRVKQGNRISYV